MSAIAIILTSLSAVALLGLLVVVLSDNRHQQRLCDHYRREIEGE
jgi:hypothetical protein